MSEPMNERSVHTMGAYPGAIPQVGVWLWAMQEARRNLLTTLGRIERAGFGQEFIDWRGADGNDNSVGTLLYHIAGVELGWLYVDILGGALPDDWSTLFPFDDRTDEGTLRHIPGVALEDHVAKLAESRRRFLDIVSAMSEEQWNELRSPPGENHSITMAWTVYHLLEHEAGHTYQIYRIVRKWLEGLETD